MTSEASVLVAMTADECRACICRLLTRMSLSYKCVDRYADIVPDETNYTLGIVDLFLSDRSAIAFLQSDAYSHIPKILVMRPFGGQAIAHYLRGELTFEGVLCSPISEGVAESLITHCLGRDPAIPRLTPDDEKMLQKFMSLDKICYRNVRSGGSDTDFEESYDMAGDEHTPVPIGSQYRVPSAFKSSEKHHSRALNWLQTPREGNLSEISLCALFHRLQKEQFAGSLTVERIALKRTVYFQDGEPVHVETNSATDDFLNYLVAEAALSAELASHTRYALIRREDEVDLMAELGALTPESIREYRYRYNEKLIIDLFRWPEARYRLRTLSAREDSFIAPLNTDTLLLNAARDCVPIDHILKSLEMLQTAKLQFVGRPDEIEAYKTWEGLTTVVDALKREITLVETLVQLPSEIQVHRVVYLLLILGLIEIKS